MAFEFHNGLCFDGKFILLTWDDATRTAVWVRFDDDGDITVRTDQHDVEQAIEPNAEFEKATHGKKFGDYVRIASVPNILVEQHELDAKLKNGDTAALSRFFNDSDNRKLRTSRGNF